MRIVPAEANARKRRAFRRAVSGRRWRCPRRIPARFAGRAPFAGNEEHVLSAPCFLRYFSFSFAMDVSLINWTVTDSRANP